MARVDYKAVMPEGFDRLKEVEHYLNSASGLERVVLELVRIRVSQMNGCGYCVGLHTAELKKLHEPEGRTADVAEWRGSSAYTHRERAALAWAEAVTDIQDGQPPEAVYEELRSHFNDAEMANLTLAITMINTWNRMEIALGSFPGHSGANSGSQVV